MAQCGDYQQPLMRPDRDATHYQMNRTRFKKFRQPPLPSLHLFPLSSLSLAVASR